MLRKILKSLSFVAVFLPALGAAQLSRSGFAFEEGFNTRHIDKLDVFAIVRPVGELRIVQRSLWQPTSPGNRHDAPVGLQEYEVVSGRNRERGCRIIAVIPPFEEWKERLADKNTNYFVLGYQGTPDAPLDVPMASMGFQEYTDLESPQRKERESQFSCLQFARESSSEFLPLLLIPTSRQELPTGETTLEVFDKALLSFVSDSPLASIKTIVTLIGAVHFPHYLGSVFGLPNANKRPDVLAFRDRILEMSQGMQGYRKFCVIYLLVYNKVPGTLEPWYHVLTECLMKPDGFTSNFPYPSIDDQRQVNDWDRPDPNHLVDLLCSATNPVVRDYLMNNFLTSKFDSMHARQLATLIPKFTFEGDTIRCITLLAYASNDLEHKPKRGNGASEPWIDKDACIRYWLDKYGVAPEAKNE